MVEFHLGVFRFVVQVKQNVVLLDGRDVGEIDAGKCVVALGPLLLAAGSGDHLAVKDNVHPVSAVVGGEKQAVRQIGARVGMNFPGAARRSLRIYYENLKFTILSLVFSRFHGRMELNS